MAKVTMSDDEMRAIARCLAPLGLLTARNLRAIAQSDSDRANAISGEVADEHSGESPSMAAAVRMALIRMGAGSGTALSPRLTRLLHALESAVGIEVAVTERAADDRARARERTLAEQHETALDVVRSELATAQARITDLETALESRRAEHAGVSADVARLTAELAQSDAERRRHMEKCDAERHELSDDLRAARATADLTRQEVLAATVALEREQGLHAGTARRLEDAQRQCSAALATVAELSAACARAEQDRDRARAEAESLRAHLDAELSVREQVVRGRRRQQRAASS